MPIYQFPCNTPQRVPLPPPQIPGSVPSWRVVFSREAIPVLKPGVNDGGADEEGYFPICAAYLEAPGCKVATCVDATVFLDDGLARCSVFLNQIYLPDAPPGGDPAILVDFVVKIAATDLSVPLVHGQFQIKQDSVSPNTPREPRGLLVTVSGPLGTQFELWARVPNLQQNAIPVEARFQFIMDRLGGQFTAYKSILVVGGGDLPTPP